MQRDQCGLTIYFSLLTLFFNSVHVLAFNININADNINFEKAHLSKVLSSSTLRIELAKFLDNVLRQIPSQKFFNLVNKIEKQNKNITDKEYYEKILNNIHTINPWIPVYNQFRAISNQKKILGEQAFKLIGDNTINGCVEIGTPGTYISSLHGLVDIKHDKWVINDKKRLSDIAQNFTLKPLNKFSSYNNFLSLNNYDEIKKEVIPSSSVDLVICFIGLHHIPTEKLPNFLTSIFRILKPGGTFLLREHDAKTEDLKSLISAAHSIFNAIINKEPVKSEISEYRNFQSLEHWINILEKHGFQVGQEKLLQSGDPTLNTMLKFTKSIGSESELSKISRLLNNDPAYKKELMQTYLTSPEWLNVDISQEYAKFIEHTPFYKFPYFKSIASYWDIFKKSWKVASQKKSNFKVLISQYTFMNLFIGMSMTLEYAAKGIISAPIRWMYSDQESDTILALIYDPEDQIEDKPKIKVKKILSKKSSIKLIEMPRYKEFYNEIFNLLESDINFLKIAGQKIIQVKVKRGLNTKNPYNSIKDCKEEYNWILPTNKNEIYSVLTLKVKKIKENIKALQNAGVQILHFHDF